ncbi:MAG: outer membrane protein transport protein, partial [Planctomycetes bacterium]|nr:outer membrane protein transport protein [Planctomycetota bacterium]
DFTRFFNATGLGLPALLFLPNGGLNGLATDVDMTLEDFELPQQVTVGFAYKPVDWFQLSADARWINWSDTFKKLTVKLENSTNPDVNALLGGSSTEATFQLNWDDQFVYAVGGEFYPIDLLALRLGYNFAKTPVPEETVNPQFPALNEHHFTTGFSLRWPRFEVHFAFEYSPRKKLESTRNLTSSDFNNSETSFELMVFSFGFTLKF